MNDDGIANAAQDHESGSNICNSSQSIVDSRKFQAKDPKDKHITNDAPRYLAFKDITVPDKADTKSESKSDLDTSVLVLVNRCQTGNPILKHIQNVKCEFKDGLIPDYVMRNANDNTSTCVLFLSIRYHILHSNYLEERIIRVKHEDVMSYRVKVVLCFVDIEDNTAALCEINRVALLSQFTLVLSWSWQEAARYLETFKVYEQKSATLIKERVETDFVAQANEVLTSVRSVNKTDTMTLLSTFGTIRNIMSASLEDLALCPGFGNKKISHLHKAFHEPFLKRHP